MFNKLIILLILLFTPTLCLARNGWQGIYLDDLTDVDITVNTLASGDLLTWDGATERWVNDPLSITGYVPYVGATADINLGNNDFWQTTNNTIESWVTTRNANNSDYSKLGAGSLIIGRNDAPGDYWYWTTGLDGYNLKFTPTTTEGGECRFVVSAGIGLSGILTSTLATGQAPLAVSSTTLNTNLNADFLDGHHWSDVPAAGANVTLSNLTNPTAINQDLIFAVGVGRGVYNANQTVVDTDGDRLDVHSGNGNGIGNGGQAYFYGGNGGSTSGTGGNAFISGGNGGVPNGQGGDLTLSGGLPQGLGFAGVVRLKNPVSTFSYLLDVSAIAGADKNIVFPNRGFTLDNITTSTTTNGTGFLKGNGSVISFDNSTYLTAEVDGSTTNELQNLWATISSQSGSTTANSQTDTLTINGGGIASTAISGDTLTVTATEADTLAAVTGRGSTTTNAITVGNFQTGANGADGKVTIYSEQGGTDYNVTLNPNATMTASADFYLPAALPGGTYFLKVGATGIMTYDSSTYLTTESDTLALVTSRGATTSTLSSFSGGALFTHPTETKSDTYNVTTSDYGKTFVMDTAAKAFNLPSVDASNIGLWFTFVKTNAGTLTIDAADSDKISDSGAGDTIYDDQAGEVYATITLQLVSATQWAIIGADGTWVTTD